ncbi:MAG: glucosidase, partial [Marivirga sp.]|nr:glucosidase [Marivirga sp.]
MTAEKQRLLDDRDKKSNWRKFGPYLTERQWGTVREDYSQQGSAWEYISHDAARSKAFRWGEEGIGGISDDKQLLCLSVALWNKKDPIIKERLFGLTGNEGNHAEDCKENYYYLDSTPTHSYMKMLYKYPQQEYPYTWLVEENRRRGKLDPEFELIDTGIFNDNRYFDVVIEYVKAQTDDLLIQITVHNRGPEKADLHVLPHAWFRNTWAWGYDAYKPEMYRDDEGCIKITHRDLGSYYFTGDGKPEALFCENETNTLKLYNYPNAGACKDGINDFITRGDKQSLNPIPKGTRMAYNYELSIPAGKSKTIRLRLSDKFIPEPFNDFKTLFAQRLEEANEFYNEMQCDIKDADEKE